MSMLPSSVPQMKRDEVLSKIAGKIDRQKYPLIVIGVRGYYLDTMGEKGKNDRNIYDDAIFIDSPNAFASFNGNVDPSAFRKGIANLVPGIYYAYQFGLHKGQYMALIQTGGKVIVARDQDKTEEGFFGINIHRGGYNTTSSLGCQTIPPQQYEGFINLALSEAKRIHGAKWNKIIIPYALI